MTKVLWTHDDYHDKWDCECGAAHVFMFDGPDYTVEHWVCEECGGGATRPLGSDGGASVPWKEWE